MNKKKVLVGSALAAAVALVGGFEGLRTTAYRDVTGVPTVCFGETRGVHMGDKYSVSDCKDMLGERLQEFSRKISACMRDPDHVPDSTYIAFLSFSYNVGAAGACHSTAMRKLNAGDIRGACDAMLSWDKAGGRVVQGLVNRREEERRVCLRGVGK